MLREQERSQKDPKSHKKALGLARGSFWFRNLIASQTPSISVKLKKSPTPPRIFRASSECLRNFCPHIWHVELLFLQSALQEVSSWYWVVRLNKPQQSKLLSSSCRVVLLMAHQEALMTSVCVLRLIAKHEQEVPNWKMKTRPRMII